MLKKLWSDEQGTVALEYMLVGTIVSLAAIVGLSTLGTAINHELYELGEAVVQVSQSYSYEGFSSCTAFNAGAANTDIDGDFSSTAVGDNGHDGNVVACTGVNP